MKNDFKQIIQRASSNYFAIDSTPSSSTGRTGEFEAESHVSGRYKLFACDVTSLRCWARRLTTSLSKIISWYPYVFSLWKQRSGCVTRLQIMKKEKRKKSHRVTAFVRKSLTLAIVQNLSKFLNPRSESYLLIKQYKQQSLSFVVHLFRNKKKKKKKKKKC